MFMGVPTLTVASSSFSLVYISSPIQSPLLKLKTRRSSDFNLDFYTEVHDLSYLVDAMGGSRFSSRFRKLTAGLCEAVQDFGLVSFVPLAIQVPTCALSYIVCTCLAQTRTRVRPMV